MNQKKINWYEDALDYIDSPASVSVEQQATRKSLARNNQHFFTETAHEKRTTLARGFVSELAARYYFKSSSTYLTPAIIHINPQSLTFSEEKIPSLTAAHILLLFYHIQKTQKKLWATHVQKMGELLIKELLLQQHFFQEMQKELECTIYT
ncbi:MAG: hypothetical protein PSV35_01595, partial [bacterium]|nr:hypothetical protein [bacterium]